MMSSVKRKIKKFLENYYGYSLFNFISDDLIKYLCKNSDKLCRLVKGNFLNELSYGDQKYLINTLENKHKLSDDDIKQIVEDKIDIIMSDSARSNDGKYLSLDLDTLYFKNKNIYFNFKKLCITEMIQDEKKKNRLISISNILASEFIDDDIIKNIKVDSNRFHNLVNLDCHILSDILHYNYDSDIKCDLINEIISNLSIIKKLNSIRDNDEDISCVLEFLFNGDSLDERVSLLDILIRDGKFDQSLDQKIFCLPVYFIDEIIQSINSEDKEHNENVLNDISNMDESEFERYCDWLKQIPEEYNEMIFNKLLINKKFLSYDMKTRIYILQRTIFSPNFEMCNEKIHFLFSNDKESNNIGFLTNIDNSYIEKTLDFIVHEENLAVLYMKFIVLNRIKKQIEDQSLSLSLYDKYLTSLNTAIKDMDYKNQIKYLDAHSKYFEKHSLKNFVEKFKRSPDITRDSLIKSLNENEKYKKLKYQYKLAEIAYQYPSDISKMINEHLSNSQTKKNKKIIFNMVNSEYFKQGKIDLQRDILNHLPGVIESVRISNDDMYIDILDSSSIKDVLDEKEKLTFVNKKTGIKVKMYKK